MRTKTLKCLVATLLICTMTFALTACAANLKGTYTNSAGLIEQSVIFKENNRVALSAFGIELEGDYIIKDGEITITYHLLGISYDWVKSFKKDGSSIYIDGTEFVKEK